MLSHLQDLDVPSRVTINCYKVNQMVRPIVVIVLKVELTIANQPGSWYLIMQILMGQMLQCQATSMRVIKSSLLSGGKDCNSALIWRLGDKPTFQSVGWGRGFEIVDVP